jgi:hypothetical protein
MERPKPAAAPPPPPPPVEEVEEEEISFDLDAGEQEIELELEEPATEIVEPTVETEAFFGVEALAQPEAGEPAVEEIGEIDFYIEQELFDEAREKVDTLLARFPDNEDLTRRRDQIDAAASASIVEPETEAPAVPDFEPELLEETPAFEVPAFEPEPEPEPAPPAPAPPPTLSRVEIEDELLAALPDDEDIIPAPPPPPPPPVAPKPAAPTGPQFTAKAAQEENLFADEDDFFDLAAELESELGAEDEPLALGEEEQSLEEIFKEFKKGVEQQLDSEDYDTHYNLGIAYKEMGLVDEAIGEFQLASKDPKRAVECASMLGLCFLEKGMPQLAIKWYRKGLEMPEISEEEHIGLLYDLGSAYVETGDTDNAQKAFMEVYGMNTNYRDIVSRIKQLEDARK